MQGKVKWFDTFKGYGFIIAEGKEHFVHHSGILQKGPKELNPGDIVDFELAVKDGKERAINVSTIKKAEVYSK